MKTSNRIGLIVVFLIVILFGVGQFFAYPNQPTTPAPSNSTNNVTPPTQVITYAASAQPTSTPVEQGSCWTNSIAASFRTDAWRCSVGNSIEDPCFQIPGSSNLLCGLNPANPAATSTFVLKLTSPLPKPVQYEENPPTNWAWLVELTDGTLCSPFTGTRPFTANGDSVSYGCAPGPLGKEVDIWGDLNNASPTWTAVIGTLSVSTSSLPKLISSSTISVAKVWQ